MGSIQSTKMGCEFRTAGERDGCRNCQHVQQVYNDRMPPYDNAGWECRRYGFKVSAMAICNTHARKVEVDRFGFKKSALPIAKDGES